MMNVSRATAGRILAEARRKTAAALVHGWAIRVTGGTMTEEIYARGNEPGRATLVESRDWGRGEITIADGPTIHRVCGRGQGGRRGGRKS